MMANKRSNNYFDEPITLNEGKRRRIPTSKFEPVENEEQRLLQLAIKNSQRDQRRVEYDIPEAPVFYPSEEEFKDPLNYIEKISSEGKKYGLCKIVPPASWNPTPKIDMSDPMRFPSRNQRIDTLQESVGFDEGKQYNIQEYKDMADNFKKEWIKKYYEDKSPTLRNFEKDYWDMVDTRTKSAEVEYANDLETTKYSSGFPRVPLSESYTGAEDRDCKDMFTEDYYARCGWNLNNLPSNKSSVLKFLKSPINGVNVPWLYIGMLFATFCWHNEDNYLYSINYSHFGDVKQWYGVPGHEAGRFENVVKDFLVELFDESPDLLHHMTTQISPSLLYGNGIPVYQVKHEPKTFIITFPKAFHCGFSYGFNVGEAVNFALDDWIRPGVEAEERYRHFARPSVFSHDRLLFTLLRHTEELREEANKILAVEALKILDEEMAARPMIMETGVRDISKLVKLPPNKFDVIDKQALDFDDLRCCHVCKHYCIFSAIACECDKNLVACIRHYNHLCSCPPTKKFMIVWASNDEINRNQSFLRTSLKFKTKKL